VGMFSGGDKKGHIQLVLKGAVLVAVLVFTFFYPDLLTEAFTSGFNGFKTYHILWLLTVLTLVKRFIPRLNNRIATGKIYKRHYRERGKVSAGPQNKVRDYQRGMNGGAIKSGIYWTVIILFIGLLYYLRVFNRLTLYATVVFFVFMDQFCVSIWCPFQWIIRNKCCNACRINNWGYLMALAPLVFIPSFWTYSVLVVSALVVIQWEYLFYRYPERFLEVFNANLTCRNCRTRCRNVSSRTTLGRVSG
jgi:hypothetical protein